MPDWLREDIPMDGESLADIFDTGEEETIEEEPEPAPRSDELDEDLVARFSPEGGDFEEDPWVQAIREEQDYNYQTDTLPQWYEERIDDPEILAKFQALEGDALAEAQLPNEDDLGRGRTRTHPGLVQRRHDRSRHGRGHPRRCTGLANGGHRRRREHAGLAIGRGHVRRGRGRCPRLANRAAPG